MNNVLGPLPTRPRHNWYSSVPHGLWVEVARLYVASKAVADGGHDGDTLSALCLQVEKIEGMMRADFPNYQLDLISLESP